MSRHLIRCDNFPCDYACHRRGACDHEEYVDVPEGYILMSHKNLRELVMTAIEVGGADPTTPISDHGHTVLDGVLDRVKGYGLGSS